MIREYAPILLIPAAWLMTLATTVYPGIDTYWIEHMHYFMLLFLTGFAVTSWKKMGSNKVLDIWRKTIVVGVLFTLIGAASFHTSQMNSLMAGLTVSYWFLAPGLATYFSSKHMEEYSVRYEKIGIESVIAFLVYATGLITGNVLLEILGLFVIAVSQFWSIVIASKLDKSK